MGFDGQEIWENGIWGQEIWEKRDLGGQEFRNGAGTAGEGDGEGLGLEKRSPGHPRIPSRTFWEPFQDPEHPKKGRGPSLITWPSLINYLALVNYLAVSAPLVIKVLISSSCP